MTAYARNPDKITHFKHCNLKVVKGQLEEHCAIEKAVKGSDAVLIALGGSGYHQAPDNTCSAGTRAIIAAMKKTGVKRMVVCSSWGAGPGNRALLNPFIQ